MATNISIPTYGFVNHILALNEGNWRTFFKPFITDSIQSGLATLAGANMTVYVSAGECRCGAVMGILDEMIALDVANGDSTYNRIDSVIVQYTYGEPSTLAVAIVQGTPSANPVPPTLTKVYDTLWQMEIAQILVPSGATSSSEFTITDKRVIYESIESIIDDNTESEERVWSSQKTHEEIVSLSTEIYDSLNTKADAIERTTSGDIVTITDGADNLPVKELVVGIEPVQDLHGYDNPWPAGGGKNLLHVTATTQTISDVKFTVNDDGSILVNGTASATATLDIGSLTFSDIVSGQSYKVNGSASITTAWIIVGYYLNNTYVSEFISSNGADTSFTPVNDGTYDEIRVRIRVGNGQSVSNKTFYPMIRASSESATFAPYSNICPISGHSQAVVTRTGKNLLRNNTVSYPYTKNDVTITKNQDGSLSLSGSNSGSEILLTIYSLDKKNLDLLDGNAYLYGGAQQIENAQIIITYYKSDGSWLTDARNINGFIISVPDGAYSARIQIRIVANANNINGITLYPQLELGSSATAYEPYQEIQQVTVQFPATLQNPEGVYYGGNVNLSTGILTIDRIKKKVGNYAWSKNTGTHIFYSNIDRTIKPQTSIICSEYKSVSWEVEEDNMPDFSIKLGTAESNQQQICIRDDRYSNASTFKSDMSDAEFVYYLNEPTIMHLHPQQISTILGLNKIWANSGDILSLTYRADMKTYVDEQVAEANLKTRQMMTTVTTKMVAPSNLVVGDIVIVNDDLYKVINSNIASGEAMVVGTNVEKITLTEYIQSLI